MRSRGEKHNVERPIVQRRTSNEVEQTRVVRANANESRWCTSGVQFEWIETLSH